jgi:hypothetical protein
MPMKLLDLPDYQYNNLSKFNLQKDAGEDMDMPRRLLSMIRSGTAVVYAEQFF